MVSKKRSSRECEPTQGSGVRAAATTSGAQAQADPCSETCGEEAIEPPTPVLKGDCLAAPHAQVAVAQPEGDGAHSSLLSAGVLLVLLPAGT